MTWQPDAGVRVAVASEDVLVGQSLTVALRGRGLAARSIEWRGADPDRSSALQLSHLRPQVGLMLCDATLSPVLAQARWLFEQHPVRWVVITGTGPGPVWGALAVPGVAGLLPSDTRLDDVVAALRAVAAGQDLLPADVREALRAQWSSVPSRPRRFLERLQRLTPREHVVLELLVRGESVRTIAVRDQVAEATVRTQVQSILRKLGVRSQLAAVAAVHLLGSDGG